MASKSWALKVISVAPMRWQERAMRISLRRAIFLLLRSGAPQRNSDGGETGFFPVLVGRIDNPPDTFKRSKKVLHTAYRKIVRTPDKKFLGDYARKEG